MIKNLIAAATLALVACSPASGNALSVACGHVAEHAWAAAEARDRGETMEEHIANYMARPWIEAYESESVIATARVAYGIGADATPEELSNEARTACQINGAAMGY